MKISMALTLDGLIRALRLQAHRLAEDAESGAAAVDAPVRRRLARKISSGPRLRRMAKEASDGRER